MGRVWEATTYLRIHKERWKRTSRYYGLIHTLCIGPMHLWRTVAVKKIRKFWISSETQQHCLPQRHTLFFRNWPTMVKFSFISNFLANVTIQWHIPMPNNMKNIISLGPIFVTKEQTHGPRHIILMFRVERDTTRLSSRPLYEAQVLQCTLCEWAQCIQSNVYYRMHQRRWD